MKLMVPTIAQPDSRCNDDIASFTDMLGCEMTTVDTHAFDTSRRAGSDDFGNAVGRELTTLENRRMILLRAD